MLTQPATATPHDQPEKKINRHPRRTTDEGLLLIILAIISGLIPPVGIILPGLIMWRNQRSNSLYHTIFVICIIVICVSLLGTYVIISDNWLHPSSTTVYTVH
ncbi:hypothetical protein [Levilactobacillus enshiensis]|uniref:hypothetical protein n=1 Tax=Levilactobacillus enshiensis TaxID=2590213 RepID=UPI00384FCC22